MGGFLGCVGMTLSQLALQSGGLGVGLERGPESLGGWTGGHWERRGSWEGMGGLTALPLGLNFGVPFWVGERSSLCTLTGLLATSFAILTSVFRSPFDSRLCRSPRE